MNQLSSTLAQNTVERVNMLMNRDFASFERIRSRSLLSKNRHFTDFFTKKTMVYVVAFIWAFLAPNVDFSIATASANDKTFIATAYYSPLPNQEKYYLGSYEADLKLNGEGNKASDGTPVFVGMIAAPKNYSFGTKIALDGLGVVSVHDRGGAISAGEKADRIDIWMGYGDEGLRRTLAWGRREIAGKIVDKNTPVSLDLQKILNNAPQANSVALTRLKALGYDTTKNFKEVVTDFQMDYNIIPSRDDEAAGIYGPKTTAKLLEMYQNAQKKSENISANPLPSEAFENTVKTPITSEKVEISEKMSLQNAENFAENTRTGFFGEYSEKVENLQKFLAKMGYELENQNGVMDLDTLRALRKYQFDKKIGQTGRVDMITAQHIITDLMK